MWVLLALVLACRTDADRHESEDTQPPTEDTPAPVPDPEPTRPTVAPRCLAPDRPPGAVDVVLTAAYPDVPLVPQTTTLLQHPAVPGWWYVLEQEGRVVRFAADPATATTEVVLDVVDAVMCCEERGLLGMALHPDFATNGYAYLDFSTLLPNGDYASTVARYTSPDGGATLDPATELVLLETAKPFSNHNGGHLAFGQDGYLYLGWGDGGGVGDPYEQAQDVGSLLGKVMRIDVDHPEFPLPYGIPIDNPFALGGGRPEVWAWGFRNPWRWEFDPATGDLWLGDVGMKDYEEINLVVPGANYGWRRMEGPSCYDPVIGCDTGNLTPPVVWMQTGNADAIIGGLVYRGAAIPELYGRYVFSDYAGDTAFVLPPAPVAGEATAEVLLTGTDDLVDWAYGLDGEAYAIGVQGKVYRLDPNPDPSTVVFPATLSATGCVNPDDPTEPGPDLVPFEPIVPFWSDGLDKSRWLAVPEGSTIAVDDDGDFELPAGSVLVKELRDGDTRLETRLLVNHGDGWAGYAYQWRSDGTDADLVAGAVRIELPTQSWDIPSRSQCLECHTTAAGRSLGLELRQLDWEMTYPDGTVANQLDHLGALGLLKEPPTHPGTLATLTGPESVEERGRAWLHGNCSYCHQPSGGTPAAIDVRVTTPLADSGLCGPPSEGTLDLPDPLILDPGDPLNSVLVLRMGQRTRDQMPPLGTFVVDQLAADVLGEWVAGMTACP